MAIPYQQFDADKILNTCVLIWDLDTIKGVTNLKWFQAPIFYPCNYSRFFSEHLFAHLIYAYPISMIIESPIWIYEGTFQLNRLTIALAGFLLCAMLTNSFLASLIGGGLLLTGWQFAQIQSTGLGWSILCLLFSMKHADTPAWKYILPAALFAALTVLSSGYLALYTPIVLLLVIAVRFLVSRALPPRKWWVQVACSLLIVGIIVSPAFYGYWKVHHHYGFHRENFEVTDFSLTGHNKGRVIEEGENIGLSRIASFQLLLFLPGSFLIVKRRTRFSPWSYSLIALVILASWMATTTSSPYAFLFLLPGFHALRAAFRWYLFSAVGLTALSAMIVDYVIRNRNLLWSIILATAVLAWIIPILQAKPLGEPFTLRKTYVYDSLKRLPPGPICILPAAGGAGNLQWARIRSERMMYQLRYKMPMTDGYSGFTPELSILIRKRLSKDPLNLNLTKLATTGVRYVVVDSMAYDTSQIREDLRRNTLVRILYDRNKEMIAALPLARVEKNEKNLKALWSRHT